MDTCRGHRLNRDWVSVDMAQLHGMNEPLGIVLLQYNSDYLFHQNQELAQINRHVPKEMDGRHVQIHSALVCFVESKPAYLELTVKGC